MRVVIRFKKKEHELWNVFEFLCYDYMDQLCNRCVNLKACSVNRQQLVSKVAGCIKRVHYFLSSLQVPALLATRCIKTCTFSPSVRLTVSCARGQPCSTSTGRTAVLWSSLGPIAILVLSWNTAIQSGRSVGFTS